MEQKNEMKNHIIKISILVIAVITFGISFSYAYYNANMSGTSEIKNATAARLDITSTLETTSVINNTRLSLIEKTQVKTKAEKLEFSVTNANTSTVSGNYFIYLTDIQLSKNLYSKYFKWELAKVTTSGETVISSGNFSTAVRVGSVTEGEANNVITTAEDITLNQTALQIPKNTTDNLIFRMWIENDPVVNQIDITKGSFTGKLRLEVAPLK